MKVASFTKYRLQNTFFAAAIFYGIVIIANIFLPIILLFALNIGDSLTYSNISSSFDFASLIFVFVVGIVSFKEELYLGLQNGISRKTQFISGIFTFLVLSLACSVLNFVFESISNLIMGTQYSFTFFSLLFSSFISENNILLATLTERLWLFGMMFRVISFGLLLGTAYNNLNNLGRVILSVLLFAAFIGLFGGSELTTSDGSGSFALALNSLIVKVLKLVFLGGNSHNPLISFACLIVISLICLAISYLVMRRAKVKA